MSGENLEFEALSHAIIGCAIKVQRTLGPGLLESTYQACLIHELRKADMNVHSGSHYLRFAKKRLGIFINFWAWPLKEGGIKRELNPNP